MKLRPYQQKAVDAAVEWMRGSVDPFIIEAATGAGKSLIIAALADHIHKHTGKRILCLAPSAELVVQNMGKYLATGNRASMYSASAGAKDLRHPVVFGSPLTVKNRISRFCRQDEGGYAMIVCDECHGITPTVQSIIDEMRKANPRLRVCGLTATPYRLGSGYIFRQWPDGRVNDDNTARDPYFQKSVCTIGARELIDQGYLTPPVIGAINAQGYDTHGLTANSMGKFDAAAVDRAYHGHGRKTAGIVADVVAQSRDRKGVMFFAATVQHAQEIMASLPPELSAIVTAETPKAMRDSILKRFKARVLKYLVNVSVLTTGFDAPHVDVIALLRKTESVGLLQQIIGRGLRIDEGKTDCLVLDYTSNLEDHCPDGDLFAPVVKASKGGSEGGSIEAVCPECKTPNSFTARPDTLDYQLDEAGYCVDLDGNRIETEYGPMPGHFGRRCFGQIRVGRNGEHKRCDYRWTSKPCSQCDELNDISARYCHSCKAEIVDPNEKLRGDFKALKKDPTRRQTDRVLEMDVVVSISSKGNHVLRIKWTTPYRQFATWLMKEPNNNKAMAEKDRWLSATAEGTEKPLSITFAKDPNSAFYHIYAYNLEPDHEPA